MEEEQVQISIPEIKLYILNQKDLRGRYFDLLKDAGTSAALRFLDQRLKILEEKEEASDSIFTEFLFDVILSLAISSVGGAILSKLTTKAVSKILGTRQSLLFIRKPKGKLKFAILKDGNGNLVNLKVKDGKPGKKLLKKIRELEKNRTKDELALLWRGSADAISNSVINVADDEVRSSFDLKSTPDLLRPQGGAIDLKTMIDNAADAQKQFEFRFMNYLYIIADDDSIDEKFRTTLYQEIEPIDFTEVEWRSMKNRYISHFEACLWVIHLKNLNQIFQTSPVPYSEYAYERGNVLLEKENATLNFGPYVKINQKDLVRYMLKNFVHPKSIDGLSIWDYFLMKKSRKSQRKRDTLKGLKKLGAPFNIEDNEHLYKELIHKELAPYLKGLSRNAHLWLKF